MQFICPRCGHIGASSAFCLPLCDLCDYKVTMVMVDQPLPLLDKLPDKEEENYLEAQTASS
jgi:hypothetical protein